MTATLLLIALALYVLLFAVAASSWVRHAYDLDAELDDHALTALMEVRR